MWDEEHSKWWFSATDIMRAINDEEDYKKCRNYWKYLKGKKADRELFMQGIDYSYYYEQPD